jgi:hypothetical protein
MSRTAPLAALVACLAIAGCGGGASGQPAIDEVSGVKVVRVSDRSHQEGDLDYDLSPPAGGAHNPLPAKCGFYDEQVPDEYAVHTLEHGAVWIAYAPDLDAAAVNTIHELARANAEVLASPYPELDHPVVLTAWARQLRLDSIDDPRVQQFIDTYAGAGTAPEAATCTAGAGDPIP